MTADGSGHYSTMIRDLPSGERPRERLRDHGAGHLSNAELIAILLRTGVAGENVLNLSVRLLSEYDGLAGLARGDYRELCSVKGLSDAKVCQLLAALELGRRLVSLHPEDRAVITGPEDVANLLLADMGRLEQEHLKVLILDSKNCVLGINQVYIGNVNSAVVRPAEVFKAAVRANAVSIIAVHNHPSGDPTPSREDASITEQLRVSGDMLGVELLDHVVLAGNAYVSLKERGLGF